MKITTPLFAIAFALFGLSADSTAQSENLQKLLDNPEKMYSKSFTYAGANNTIRKWQIKKGFATEADYKMPARVGILTFMLEDMSESSTTTFGSTTVQSTRKATKDGASGVATYIYDHVIDDLKAIFGEKGYDIARGQ